MKLHTSSIRFLSSFFVFLSLFCIGSLARDYSLFHSFKPPYVLGGQLPQWDLHGTAEFAQKYIRFNPRHVEKAYFINNRDLKFVNWESRIQTWTGGIGEAGYSVLLSSTSEHSQIEAGEWSGLSIDVKLEKGGHNDQDAIKIELVEKKGQTTKVLGTCAESYHHNPNLFLYFKFHNQKFDVKFAYESTTKFVDCLSVTYNLSPGQFFALSSISPDSDPVERQDLYALYTYELQPAPGEEPVPDPESKPYQPPKPSNFQNLLTSILKKAEKTANIPMSDQIALYNEFFHDVETIDQQHNHLKEVASKIKDIIVDLQLDQEEEHSYFESTLTGMLSEAATAEDIKELVSKFNQAENSGTDTTHPAYQLSMKVGLLKEIVSASAKQLNTDLEEFGTNMKAIKNSLDISHNEHKAQISSLNSLTKELSKTVEENSNFGFWTFFILFQFMYFLGLVWWVKVKNSSAMKKDY